MSGLAGCDPVSGPSWRRGRGVRSAFSASAAVCRASAASWGYAWACSSDPGPHRRWFVAMLALLCLAVSVLAHTKTTVRRAR